MVRRVVLFCLMALSLTLSATVHAGELPGAIVQDCAGFVHSDGDADQTSAADAGNAAGKPGDPDMAVQHHGHCHVASALLPCRAVPASHDDSRPITPAFRNAAAPSLWVRSPSLRPPIA